jgi:UDP:flavonoid glycosyltransferase YjiC (YdhE family)
MATILMTWELGGGLGHLMQLLPLARGLVARGHTVVAALRDLSKVENVFGPGPVRYLQAPIKMGTARRVIRPPVTFAHLLHNCGFAELPELRTLTSAWRNLIAMSRPDLILFDHSPAALLASRAFGTNVRRVVIGSGFCIPPDVPSPPFVLRPWLNADPASLAADEKTLLDRVNHLLGEWRRLQIERVAQIYSEVDDTFLLTFRELEHFPERQGAVYRGAWTEGRGKPPQWPAAEGRKRIYAYLKDFPSLPLLLQALRQSGHAVIVYADGVSAELRKCYTSDTLRFEMSPLHLGQAAKECDLAILNSGHGTTAAMLLAGKPALLIPIYLEQGLLAKAAERNTGAALEASHKDGEQVVQRLEKMLGSDDYADAAHRFAARYADFDPVEQNERMVDRMEQLIAGRATTQSVPRANAGARSEAAVPGTTVRPEP